MRIRIQCNVCQKGAASVVCGADQAALCPKCDDAHVHAANTHPRLELLNDSQLDSTATLCDICREKHAFIFCVEDRALFCQLCDRTIHSASKLAATHQRLLAAGVRQVLPTTASPCNNNLEPNHNHPPKPTAQTVQSPHDFDLHKEDFGELEWLTEMGLFGEGSSDNHQSPQEPPPPAAATVPKLPHPSSYKSNNRPYIHKKPKIDISANVVDHDDQYVKVPDLG